MYWFGKMLTSGERPWEGETFWKCLPELRLALSRSPVHQIIDILDSFGKLWIPGGELFEEALPILQSSSGFSPEEVGKTLGMLPSILSRESLEKRVKSEFFPMDILDRFSKTPHFSGKVRALPLGTVLHVTAGNVFLSSIDSLIMGLLTKNLNILKVSSQNTYFPFFFAEKLRAHDKKNLIADKFAVLHWKGGDYGIERIFKSKVDAIVAWGGDEMIESMRRDLPPHVKFLGFGPKISMQLITLAGLKEKDLDQVARWVVEDIVPWDQSACASPQDLFIQEGIDENKLLSALERAFSTAPARGELDPDEAVEILKERYRGLYSDLMGEGRFAQGENYLFHLESNKYLRPSPLHRSLIIKRFKDEKEIFSLLAPFAWYLQSCSYLLDKAEKDAYLELLATAGIKRFAPLGTVTLGMEGAPHDGRNVLRELTQMVGDEYRGVDYGQMSCTLTGSAEVKNEFEKGNHPLGYIFSSGGTTGEPKFLHFSYEEFDQITDMLAHNIRAQGITAGMTVANLFVAGNLWSSFMAIEKALEKVGAIQLPIGGLCATENIVFYLKKFKPDVVMGLPSLLIMNAEYASEKGIELEVPRVFYAGEGLTKSRRDYLQNIWKTSYFGSAGYASVDAGMIAYQCDKCGPGEHHLFTGLVDLKIVNEEAIVTSHYRTTLPIVNYRTGDRIEWVEDNTCGRNDKKFKLLGRIDNIIQIWSCRLRLDDIEMSLTEAAPEVNTWQVTITEEKTGDRYREIMQLSLEEEAHNPNGIIQRIYENSRDLKDTLSFVQFRELVRIKHAAVARNARTGKVSLLKDLRH